ITCRTIPALPIIHHFFARTSPPEIYPLSLHDALPICRSSWTTCSTPLGTTSGTTTGDSPSLASANWWTGSRPPARWWSTRSSGRSEEHTSELQSREKLVCRLLLEKKRLKLIPPSL